jgi:hypothetical protein
LKSIWKTGIYPIKEYELKLCIRKMFICIQEIWIRNEEIYRDHNIAERADDQNSKRDGLFLQNIDKTDQ